MRRALVFAWVVALVAGASPASAGSECGFDHTRIEPIEGLHTYVETETRDCPDGRSLTIAIADAATGRTSVEWYDDERGAGLEVFHPPYYASWTDTDRGCSMVVFVFALGEVPLPCVAGSPPPPPTLP